MSVNPKKIILSVNMGGLGDNLLITPSLGALKQKYQNSKITILCYDLMVPVFLNNPNVDKIIKMPNDQNDWFRLIKKSDKFYKTDYFKFKLKSPINCSEHAVDIMAKMMDVKLENKNLEIFLTENEEKKATNFLKNYKNPIIFSIGSALEIKEWCPQKWNELIKSLPGNTFIQVGTKNDRKINNSIDLRGKTSIRGLCALIKFSKLFIGLDSFGNHITNAVDTKGIILWGPSAPWMWGYKKNINIHHKLECSPCIDKMASCEINKCMKTISVEGVQEKVISVMSQNLWN